MKKKKNDTDGMCVPSESSECEKDEKGIWLDTHEYLLLPTTELDIYIYIESTMIWYGMYVIIVVMNRFDWKAIDRFQ